MILKVGLTGGIASGKSTVARMFRELGCFVVDADDVVRELYRPGADGYRAIVRQYGPEILDANGEIDRMQLSQRALGDEASARALNALIHPLVMRRVEEIVMNEEMRGGGRDMIALVEATLLLEAGEKAAFDRMIVVDVDPRVQMARAIGRGMKREEVERRMARQMSREERLRNADYIISNNDGLEPVASKTRKVFAELQRDLARRKAGR